MTGHPPDAPGSPGVTVRYWAAARSAAGVASDTLPITEPTTLDVILKQVYDLHRDRPRLYDVVAVCSILVEDRPVGGYDPQEIVVKPGQTVELLPPFAGG